jgi:protoporphyrinogen/coproporphyrinogen III oxidase
MNKHHVVIVGGGLSGLSTAFFLSRRASQEHCPFKITVLEASNRFGGVLRTLTQGELRMEAGADAFYAGKKDATDLCRELGLQEDLVEAAPCFRRFFTLKDQKPFSVGGRQDSFLGAARYLCDPRLSFSAKCRMLAEPFIPRRKEAGDESLASFIRRRLGQGFYRAIAKPLVQSVYMTDPERLSLGALFPRLQQAERNDGSLARSFLKKKNKKEKGTAEFLTLRHGLEGLAQALVRELGTCELRQSTRVRQCAYNKEWEIFTEEGASLRADSFVLAMNACDASKLLSAVAPELSRALATLRYDSIATVNLIYKSEEVPARDLDPGFLVPMEGESYPFSSLKWLGKSADGKCLLLRAFLSETMMPDVFKESDEVLKQKVVRFLGDFFGIQAKPLFIDVRRYPSALPQYETGHLERVAQIEKMVGRYPGLYVTGNGFRGFGITDCVRQARLVASGLQLSTGRNHS